MDEGKGVKVMRETKGFTLLELMIVVAVIAVVAAIAIPNLLRSRMQANESAAIQDLRVIAGAEISHHLARQRFGSFADLTSVIPEFVDAGWVEGREKSGYTFSIPNADANTFSCFADPIVAGVTGERYFRTDESGAIRYSHSGQPEKTAPPIGS